jgi:hypothetical protein
MHAVLLDCCHMDCESGSTVTTSKERHATPAMQGCSCMQRCSDRWAALLVVMLGNVDTVLIPSEHYGLAVL